MEFRLSQAYKLTALQSLNTAQRKAVEGAVFDISNIGGCLLPAGENNGPPLKILSITAFELIQSITEPRLQPDQSRAHAFLNALIFDHMIEIKKNDAFITGPHACFYKKNRTINKENEFLNLLSFQAIKTTLGYKNIDVDDTSSKLYAFNRRLLSPFVASQNQDSPDGGRKYVGLFEMHNFTGFEDIWLRHKTQDAPSDNYKAGYDDTWALWHRNDLSLATQKRNQDFKLYISVRHEILRQHVVQIVRMLNEGEAHAFKIGRRISDILRPDYFIVYYKDFATLNAAAAQLANILKDSPAHGVPFTCALNQSGSLSWGTDPKPEGHMTKSWRSIVCHKLALAMAQTHRCKFETPTEKFSAILNRLEMDGIDTHNWRYNAEAEFAGA